MPTKFRFESGYGHGQVSWKTAYPVAGVLVVLSAFPLGSDFVLEVAASDYYTYNRLPDVVEYDGRRYGKTGWNSDVGLAYYKTSAKIATVV
jgi:hypothetical protein